MPSLFKAIAADDFGNKYPFPRRPDHINHHVLAAATAESDTPPAGAKVVVIANNLALYINWVGTAAVPAADVTNGAGMVYLRPRYGDGHQHDRCRRRDPDRHPGVLQMSRYYALQGSNPALDAYKAGMEAWAGITKGTALASRSEGLSPAEAREVIAATLADPETAKAYNDKSHPKHEEVFLKMGWIHRVAYPKEAPEKIDVPAAAAPAPAGTAPSAMTSEQALVAIAGRYADKDFGAAYYDNVHPGHTLAVQQMADLHRAAYPDKAEVLDVPQD